MGFSIPVLIYLFILLFSLKPWLNICSNQELELGFSHLFADRLTGVFSQVILKDVDSLLYVDTDVLFLRPMDDVWSLFKSFNGTQLAAMAPEHEVPKIGWYSRFARHPFYGVTGVNSGVMLMNLTRIRSTLFKVRPPKCSSGEGWRGGGNLWVCVWHP